MQSIARVIHVWAAWLAAAGVLLQGYLAGAALAELGGSGDFSSHIDAGYSLMGLLVLAVLVTALLGRYPRAHVGWAALLVLLYVVQTSLPFARTDAPAIAALHPLNAMLMFVLAVAIAVRARGILRSAGEG